MSLRKGAEMERLTYRTELGVSIDKNEDCPTCSICWNCDIPPRKCGYISDALKKLADYEDLEEQGRLVKLPCKIGTEVYDITWWDNVQKKVVVKGKTYYRTIHKHKVSKSTFGYTDIEEIGKTVFLTKSEAEAKLKELRGGENEWQTE